MKRACLAGLRESLIQPKLKAFRQIPNEMNHAQLAPAFKYQTSVSTVFAIGCYNFVVPSDREVNRRASESLPLLREILTTLASWNQPQVLSSAEDLSFFLL